MDQATPIGEAAKLLAGFDQGYDVVIGSRGAARRNAPSWRKFMSASQIVLRNVILGFRDITDTQCGFKAFRREAASAILNSLHLYRQNSADSAKGAMVTSGFDVEIKIVVIGAGSASFGLNTLAALMRSERLRGSALALVDFNAEALNTVGRLAGRLNREWDAQMAITTHARHADALDGAHFVVQSIEAPPREKLWRQDFEIPLKHGWSRHNMARMADSQMS